MRLPGPTAGTTHTFGLVFFVFPGCARMAIWPMRVRGSPLPPVTS